MTNRLPSVLMGLLVALSLPRSGEAQDQPTPPQRARSGLLALYDFADAEGDIVRDRSGNGQALDLKISQPAAVRRRHGALTVRSQTMIASDDPAKKIIDAVKLTDELSIEAWVQPANTDQEGPARIVTLSKDAGERNFTLGQQRDAYDVRLRTTKTNTNGIPSISTPTKSLTTALTHVVYTRSRFGKARIYLDGQEVSQGDVSGSMDNWDDSFRLAIGNELSSDQRLWQGTYHLVAVYNLGLSESEVQQNYRDGVTSRQIAANPPDPKAHHFETRIAPLLANHCLECHDSPSKKGGLDLSRKATVFAGGETGPALVLGKSAESLLWEAVESDEMPQDRPPLSSDEKQRLKKWIDDGAVWSLDVIDPAAYRNEGDNRNWVRRLTVPEYIATVRTSVGVDIAKEAREILPPELRADGFSNTAYNLNVDLKHVEAYGKLAEIIVDRMDTVTFAGRFSGSQKFTDDDMGELVSKMGEWLLRGPLDKHDVITYRGISTTVAGAGGNFDEAVRYMIAAMLQSPRFVYRIENQRGDGTPWPAGQFELASRLSYTLWGSSPDEELFKAAQDRRLDHDGVRQQVQRMLGDPRAVERSLHFARQWLNLDRLDNLQPSPEKFPKWDNALAHDMRLETLAFFEEVVWQQPRPLSELLSAQVTFATPRLAKHYGLKSPPTGDDSQDAGQLARYDVSGEPGRGGLLTQGSVLTIGGDEASMVTRGLFVLYDLLRGVVRDPPPCVDTSPVPTKAGLTQRNIAEARIANESCGGCHAKFEPLAFGLEKFDGLGTFHDHDEHGNALREDGEVLVPGQEKPVSYKSSSELMDLLAGSSRVQESLTWKLVQFAIGRPLVAADIRIVANIHEDSVINGGTYQAVMTEIVLSDLVQLTRTEIDE